MPGSGNAAGADGFMQHGREPERPLPSLGLVVARSHPGNVIGRDNRLPWHLSSDLRRFRALTLGHAILMGRKTYASIGRPLPGRLSIVVSRSARARPPEEGGGLRYVPTPDAGLAAADAYAAAHGSGEVFVVGGSEIFRYFLEAGLVSRVYLTSVEAPRLAGDALFEERFAADMWKVVHSEAVAAGPGDEFPSQFQIIERLHEVVRHPVDAQSIGTAADRSVPG